MPAWCYHSLSSTRLGEMVRRHIILFGIIVDIRVSTAVSALLKIRWSLLQCAVVDIAIRPRRGWFLILGCFTSYQWLIKLIFFFLTFGNFVQPRNILACRVLPYMARSLHPISKVTRLDRYPIQSFLDPLLPKHALLIIEAHKHTTLRVVLQIVHLQGFILVVAILSIVIAVGERSLVGEWAMELLLVLLLVLLKSLDLHLRIWEVSEVGRITQPLMMRLKQVGAPQITILLQTTQ